MSVDCKILMNGRVSLDSIVAVIKRKRNIDKVEIEKYKDDIIEGIKEKTAYIVVKFKDKSTVRLFFLSGECLKDYKNTIFYGKPYVFISAGSRENVIDLCKKILKNYGGYIDENDCDSKDFKYIKGDENYTADYAKAKEYEKFCKMNNIK